MESMDNAAYCSHFYPRSPCGERLHILRNGSHRFHISIHALLAESDAHIAMQVAATEFKFLSTLSLRRATACPKSLLIAILYFYPRSPCGERHRNIANGERKKNISIHALLAESDICVDKIPYQRKIFLSTLSLRRATSYHFMPKIGTLHFYPRSPCGERQHLLII